MIERYTRPEMGRVWSEAHKYELWCRVETLVLEAHARAGTVPAGSVAPVRAAAPPTPEAVAAIEAVTGHDVIAFLSAWADNTVPREAAAYVHFGMTSSDLLDTALALQLTEATDLLLARCTALTAALRDHALAHRGTLRVGRTHGIHAEPDVWGHRVADFAFAMARCRDRLLRAREAVAVGKLSGPVGTYSNIDPAIEAEVMAELGLRPGRRVDPGGVPRRDQRVGQRNGTDLDRVRGGCPRGQARAADGIAELAEPFGRGQKGSSAMPHKKNPVRSERICGLARMVRAQIVPVMEGIPLWHERDISHSSTERVALPDAAIGTDFLLDETTALITGLQVDDGTDAGEPGRDARPDLQLGGAARAGRGRACPARMRTRWSRRRPWTRTRPGRRSGRRSASTRPSAASRWTRPGWTRRAARNATWRGSAGCSSGWSGWREPP